MRAEPPRVDARLRAVVGKLGYAVKGTNHDHSAQAYRLKYGSESIKLLLTSHYIITLYLYFVIDIQAGMEYLFQA